MNTTEKPSIWKQVQQIPIWGPNLLAVILIIVLQLFPVGLPAGISQQTREIYNAIEELPAGTMVIFHHQYHAGNWGELAGAGSAILQQLFRRGSELDIVVITQSSSGPAFFDLYWSEPETYGLPGNREETLEHYGKTYGEDYVEFGYLTGMESGARLIADDFYAGYPNDIFGTPVEDIPLMSELKTAADVDTMIILHSWEAYNKFWLRQWQGRFGTQFLVIASGLVYPSLSPYYPNQQLYTAGLRASGEYEALMGYTSIGAAFGDSFSLVALMMVLLVVVGNIGQYMERREGKKR